MAVSGAPSSAMSVAIVCLTSWSLSPFPARPARSRIGSKLRRRRLLARTGPGGDVAWVAGGDALGGREGPPGIEARLRAALLPVEGDHLVHEERGLLVEEALPEALELLRVGRSAGTLVHPGEGAPSGARCKPLAVAVDPARRTRR